MTYVRIPVPRINAGFMCNALGILGLVLMVTAVGGLAGVWWAVLAAGITGIGLSYLISAQLPATETEIEPKIEEHTTRFRAAR